MMISRITLFVLAVAILSACTHTLELTSKPSDMTIERTPQNPVRLGLNATDDQLLNAVINEIGVHSRVADIKKDYHAGDAGVDYEILLKKDVTYNATGQNFFITFPGFIIFTHAWLGYKYTVDIETTSVLMDPNGSRLNEAVIQTPYEFRFTSFPRGAAASLVGFFTPGFGILAVIPGGIFAANYDERANTELVESITPSFRSFVSGKVIEQIASASNSSSTSMRLNFSKEPEVINIGGDVRMTEVPDERTFVTHVMKIENGNYIPVDIARKELTDDAMLLLQRLDGNVDGPVTREDLRTAIAELGIAETILPEQIDDTAVYTLRGSKMVALYQGKNNLPQVAQK
jgi:hypothetical protein